MSTTTHKIPLAHAQKLANRLVELLAPHCERIQIAGSIRREKPEIGDIEIVCAPKLVAADIFALTKIPTSGFWAQLHPFKKLKGKDDFTGRYYQYRIPTGWDKPDFISLDIFIPQLSDYYRQLAIRTGSSNYSGTVIAQGWRKLGWVGTFDGLRREEGRRRCRCYP